MSFIEHMIFHGVEALYRNFREFGYQSRAKEHYINSGFSENVAEQKADAFAKEMEEAKERGESKNCRRAICIRYGLPVSLFFKR